MKSAFKIVLFIGLSIAIAQFSMMAAFAQDAPGLKTEAATLENFYKEKVSGFVNHLVDPKDYAIVVTANLKNDEQKLKEYHEAVDRKFLPGLYMQDPLGFNDAHNILLDLKQKVEVQVILSENVPADRDNLIKDVVRTNLRLNEEAGDSVNVVRAARTVASVDAGGPHPKKLAELSGRMIAFWIIVLLLAVAGLTFWLYRRHKKEEGEAAEEKDLLDKDSIDVSAEDDSLDGESEEEEAAEKTPEQLEAERDALQMQLAFGKGELVKLAKEYPNIVCRAAEEFIAQGKIHDTVNFMEALGWEQAKLLFKEMDGRIWTRIGAALRERDADPTEAEVFASLHLFHRFALSFVLERAGRDTDNPFSFIFHLTESQRMDLLQQEKAENIALVAIYCSGPQMGELLDGLEQEKQHDVLLNITKIRHLPEMEVKESVDALLMRLERIKADPSVYVDGPTLAADFMRSLPPIREEELYQTLIQNHPEEAEKLRRVRVMFQDIPYYPADMIRPIIESYESEDLMRALTGFDSQFVESFLSLLPTKKALMIQNDLYHMADQPPASLCAENRRKISTRVEHEFELKRFSVNEFWRQMDQNQADQDASRASLTDEITEVQAVTTDGDQPVVFEDDEDQKNGSDAA